MTGLGTWLLAIAQPLIARIFVALGMTVMSLVGVMEAYATLKEKMQNSLTAAPTAALQLAALAGVPEGLALVLGAISFVISLWLTTSATKLVFK